MWAVFKREYCVVPFRHHFDEKSGNAKFSPKATVTIPSSEYLTLINVIDRAHKCFESEDPTVKEGSWETFILKYSKVHYLMAKYEKFEGEMALRFVIRWNFVNDTNWNRLVARGIKDAIDTSELLDKEWTNLKKGANLNQRHLEVFQSQMPTILEKCFHQNPDAKDLLLKFVDEVLANERLKGYLLERLPDFEAMNYQKKMQILSSLLNELYVNIEEEEEPPKKKGKGIDYIKMYLEILSNKVMLVFGLLTYYLRQ